MYDAAARWDRTHQYPGSHDDFVTRVQRTLQLLSEWRGTQTKPSPAGDRGLAVAMSPESARALEDGPRAVLTAWLEAHARTAFSASCGASVDGAKSAA